jgi:hypothetical protein
VEPLLGDVPGAGGYAVRTPRRRLADTTLLLVGIALLLVPYAGGNRLLRGAFVVTAFDGWTLFGTVGEHVEVEGIEDPIVREVFETHRDALTALSPSALRWSPQSPATQLDRRYREGYVDIDVRARLRRDGIGTTLAALWDQPLHPEIRANRALRRIARRTVRDHPAAYARGALSRFGAYWLGRERTPSHFQSLAGTGPEEVNFRLPKLRGLLTTRFETDVPPSGSGVLLAARYVAYDLRILLLLPVLVALVAAVRSRRWDGPTRIVVGSVLLALSLSAGTAAVAEIYDRYTVVTDVLLLVAAAAAIARLGAQATGASPAAGDDGRDPRA